MSTYPLFHLALPCFAVHPEQLPQRPWITLKERDQMSPTGKFIRLNLLHVTTSCWTRGNSLLYVSVLINIDVKNILSTQQKQNSLFYHLKSPIVAWHHHLLRSSMPFCPNCLNVMVTHLYTDEKFQRRLYPKVIVPCTKYVCKRSLFA